MWTEYVTRGAINPAHTEADGQHRQKDEEGQRETQI